MPSGDPDGEDRLARSLRFRVPLYSPGMPAYVTARTRFYDEALLGATASGATQVVIVAAGYDARAVRFRQPGVQFFELDHSVTQADKRARLDGVGVDVSDVRFAPVDLGHDSVADTLGAAGHDPGRVTHFMCEGLTPYVPGEDLAGLFRALRDTSAPDSTLAVDFMERGSGVLDRTRMAFVRLPVAAMGERMVTLPSPAETRAALESTGWTKVNLSPSPRGLPGVFALARA